VGVFTVASILAASRRVCQRPAGVQVCGYYESPFAFVKRGRRYVRLSEPGILSVGLRPTLSFEISSMGPP